MIAQILVLSLAAACASAQPGPPSSSSSSPSAPVTSPPTSVTSPIDDWIAQRALSRQQVLVLLGLDASQLEEARAYGPSAGLSIAYSPEAHPGRFYLDGDNVLLIYVSDDASLETLRPAQLAARFPPKADLRSRAGKRFTQHVDTEGGIAWSDNGSEIAFVEIFEPTDLDSYKAKIWTDPGPFRK